MYWTCTAAIEGEQGWTHGSMSDQNQLYDHQANHGVVFCTIVELTLHDIVQVVQYIHSVLS